MFNRPRVFIVWARAALAFLGSAMAWLLLVGGFGVGPLAAGLVALAATLAFAAAITPAVACVALSHSRAFILWLTPIAALPAAFGGLLAFHWLLQLFTAGIPSALSDVVPRAEAGGSVVVWAVLSVSMLFVALASHASKFLRSVAALASAGLAVGLVMWVRALGV